MSLALRAETGILLLGVPKRTASSSVFGKKGPGSEPILSKPNQQGLQ